jgi:hypothetical protein
MYRHFLSDYLGNFLFSRFDWSIVVTQLVAKHVKEIITKNYILRYWPLFSSFVPLCGILKPLLSALL